VRALKGHEIDVPGLAFKLGDGLYGCFPCRTPDTLLVFGSNGRVYSVAVAVLPGRRGDGVPITTVIDLEAGTQIAHHFAGSADSTLLLAKAGDMVGRNRGGKVFLTLDAQDRVLPPVVVAASHTQVACLALAGRLLVFALDELKLQANDGKGLTLMDVDAKAPLVSAASCAQALLVQGSGRGGKPKEELLKGAALAEHVGKRARTGRKIDGFVKPQRVVAA
jgi:topoisomerase IV subunit A